jgi:hypothetical protein
LSFDSSITILRSNPAVSFPWIWIGTRFMKISAHGHGVSVSWHTDQQSLYSDEIRDQSPNL